MLGHFLKNLQDRLRLKLYGRSSDVDFPIVNYSFIYSNTWIRSLDSIFQCFAWEAYALSLVFYVCSCRVFFFYHMIIFLHFLYIVLRFFFVNCSLLSFYESRTNPYAFFVFGSRWIFPRFIVYTILSFINLKCNKTSTNYHHSNTMEIKTFRRNTPLIWYWSKLLSIVMQLLY